MTCWLVVDEVLSAADTEALIGPQPALALALTDLLTVSSFDELSCVPEVAV